MRKLRRSGDGAIAENARFYMTEGVLHPKPERVTPPISSAKNLKLELQSNYENRNIMPAPVNNNSTCNNRNNSYGISNQNSASKVNNLRIYSPNKFLMEESSLSNNSLGNNSLSNSVSNSSILSHSQSNSSIGNGCNLNSSIASNTNSSNINTASINNSNINTSNINSSNINTSIVNSSNPNSFKANSFNSNSLISNSPHSNSSHSNSPHLSSPLAPNSPPSKGSLDGSMMDSGNTTLTNDADASFRNCEPPPLPPKPKILPIRPSNWGQNLRTKQGLYLEQPTSSFV